MAATIPQRRRKPTLESNRDRSDSLRQSVFFAALEMGVENQTVAKWMFDDEIVTSPELTSDSTGSGTEESSELSPYVLVPEGVQPVFSLPPLKQHATEPATALVNGFIARLHAHSPSRFGSLRERKSKKAPKALDVTKGYESEGTPPTPREKKKKDSAKKKGTKDVPSPTITAGYETETDVGHVSESATSTPSRRFRSKKVSTTSSISPPSLLSARSITTLKLDESTEKYPKTKPFFLRRLNSSRSLASTMQSHAEFSPPMPSLPLPIAERFGTTFSNPFSTPAPSISSIGSIGVLSVADSGIYFPPQKAMPEPLVEVPEEGEDPSSKDVFTQSPAEQPSVTFSTPTIRSNESQSPKSTQKHHNPFLDIFRSPDAEPPKSKSSLLPKKSSLRKKNKKGKPSDLIISLPLTHPHASNLTPTIARPSIPTDPFTTVDINRTSTTPRPASPEPDYILIHDDEVPPADSLPATPTPKLVKRRSIGFHTPSPPGSGSGRMHLRKRRPTSLTIDSSSNFLVPSPINSPLSKRSSLSSRASVIAHYRKLPVSPPADAEVHPGLFSQPIPAIQRGREAPFPVRPLLPREESSELVKKTSLRLGLRGGNGGGVDLARTARYKEMKAISDAYHAMNGLVREHVRAPPAADVPLSIHEEQFELDGQAYEPEDGEEYEDDEEIGVDARLPSATSDLEAFYFALAQHRNRRERDGVIEEEDDVSRYPEEDKTAGRMTMYRLENGSHPSGGGSHGGGGDRRSVASTTWSRSSVFMDGETSGATRDRFVKMVDALYGKDGREKEEIPPVPTLDPKYKELFAGARDEVEGADEE